MRKKTEILAPVADMEMCKAAIHGGADAIYLGAPYFNARGRAPDLSSEHLKMIIDECHLYGVQVFFALNILLFERELQKMPEYLKGLIELGADALIVQDLGLVRLLRQMVPDFPIHASTQMTVSSPESIKLLRDLNIDRFVLAREMSLGEIKAVKEQCTEEIEVFVHGALCVSYSGQCLTSESFGGRSANRGQCAQSCRLDYELWVDGEKKASEGRKYLFSPKDLCGIAEVPQLVELGVESLKIEGRLKEPEYVAAAAQSYRLSRDFASVPSWNQSALQMAFSRGFHSGWLHGVAHQELVGGLTSSHVGQWIGQIQKQNAKEFSLSGTLDLELGDGLWLQSPQGEQSLGARIYGLRKVQNETWVDLGRECKLPAHLQGWSVYRNDAPKVEKQIRQIWKDRDQHRKIALDLEFVGSLGSELKLVAVLEDGMRCELQSDLILEAAAKQALGEEQMRSEFGALGDSPYQLRQVKLSLVGDLFARNKQLRELKRQLIDRLNALRTQVKVYDLDLERVRFPETAVAPAQQPQLHLLVRHEEQIDYLQDLPLASVTMDLEWGKDYKKGLEKIKALGYKAGIASLRIHKPGENHHLKLIEKLAPDQVLVRNLGSLHYLAQSGFELIGDHGLNVTNSLAYEYFLSKGLSRLMPGHDLSATQLVDLLSVVGGARMEFALHHYMPTFHMEHCVFAAFLSQGNSWKDCGKPCERHRVEVRDHKGASHFLRADQECRNTLFNGTPQSSARLWSAQEMSNSLADFGLADFRIELLDEDRETIRSKVLAYDDLIRGRINPAELYARIGVLEKYGVAEGQLFQELSWSNRKKDARMNV